MYAITNDGAQGTEICGKQNVGARARVVLSLNKYEFHVNRCQ